jgi:hypothetical protein
MKKFLEEWPARHQHPVSRVLHAIGIPMTILAVPLALWQLHEGNWPAWWCPVVLLVVGFGIQYIGHVIEGNDMGEIVGIKKRLGKPYVDVSPRYKE